MSELPTLSNRDRFFRDFTVLAGALALFYDPEGKSDAEIADEYVAEKYSVTLEQLKAEGNRFLRQHELPMELIADYANRYLVTEAEQRQWLQTLLDRIQAELEARQMVQGSKQE